MGAWQNSTGTLATFRKQTGTLIGLFTVMTQTQVTNVAITLKTRRLGNALAGGVQKIRLVSKPQASGARLQIMVMDKDVISGMMDSLIRLMPLIPRSSRISSRTSNANAIIRSAKQAMPIVGKHGWNNGRTRRRTKAMKILTMTIIGSRRIFHLSGGPTMQHVGGTILAT